MNNNHYSVEPEPVTTIERGATVMHRRSATSVIGVERGASRTSVHLADFTTLSVPNDQPVLVVRLRKELR